MSNGGMSKMMKQLQKAQQEMNRMQEELASKTVESSSGGGAVRVVADGQKNLVSLDIDPEAMGEDNREMLEDMIIAAVNDAFQKVDDMIASEMQKVTGGMNLPPGMF